MAKFTTTRSLRRELQSAGGGATSFPLTTPIPKSLSMAGNSGAPTFPPNSGHVRFCHLGYPPRSRYRPTRDTLFLARDRMGQKPAVLRHPGGRRRFRQHDSQRARLARSARAASRGNSSLCISFWATCRPANHLARHQPGSSPAGGCAPRKDVLDGGIYWSQIGARENPRSEFRNPKRSAKEMLRSRCAQSVQSQLDRRRAYRVLPLRAASIPQSSLRCMQQAVHAAGGGPIHTVSVGFTEAGFDETQYAAALAKKSAVATRVSKSTPTKIPSKRCNFSCKCRSASRSRILRFFPRTI